MRFYRVETRTEGGNSAGIRWFTSKREAEAYRRENMDPNEPDNNPDEVEMVDIEPTKAGILRALCRWAAHPDNG